MVYYTNSLCSFRTLSYRCLLFSTECVPQITFLPKTVECSSNDIYITFFLSYLAPFSWSRFTGVNSSLEPLDDFLLLFFWWCLWGFRTFTVIGGRSIPYVCSFSHFPCRWRNMETTITRTNTPNVTAIAIMLVFTELAGWGGSQVWCLKTSL